MIQAWEKLSEQSRRNIFAETAAAIGLPDAAVEKDWWVVQTLKMVFETSIANHIVFKGGTSLSKAWNLIDRFSEDIDLALDRRFLGFHKPMTSSQVSKLRRHSFKYLSENFLSELSIKLVKSGFGRVGIQLANLKDADQDPVGIELFYPAVTETIAYLQPRILIEIGSRSLMEPNSLKSFSSMVGEHFKGFAFAEDGITVPTVNPEKTFLEKIFLLHESFSGRLEKIQVERKSRHLYDLEKLMDTHFADKALNDKLLYEAIVEHRRTLTPIRGLDYNNHKPGKIDPVPPEAIIGDWEKDYLAMQKSMFYKASLPFAQLIERITALKNRINSLS